MEYSEYKAAFLESIQEAILFDSGNDNCIFVQKFVELLNEYDLLDSSVFIDMDNTSGYRNRTMRMDGFSFDVADQSLELYIADYDDNPSSSALTMTLVNDSYWKLFYYLTEAVYGDLGKYCSPDSDAIKAGKLLKNRLDENPDSIQKVLRIKFIIFTNRELDSSLYDKDLIKNNTSRKTKKKKTSAKIKKDEFKDCPLEVEIWNIERLYELDVANNEEVVEIDFPEDFDSLGIPCLECEVGNNLDYSAYMAVIPGKLLSNIYLEYGSKVLEGNVRAFLGTRNSKSVNSGMKRTINNEPTKFFTYNNGIAATAADVRIEERDGQKYITNILDFQIINGGQTTATLAEAVLKKTNIFLNGIYVPAKITVIKNRDALTEDGVSFYDQMVKDIAKYANSQNKVTAADLFSNDPFHIWMEKASKRYLAPPVNYSIQTGWYYERARKKFDQETIKLKGDALKRFKAKYPAKQKITKEDLAKYYTIIQCRPDIASKGRNWVMKEFGQTVSEEFKQHPEKFNEHFFHKCIGATILFKYTDYYLESNKRDPDFWYNVGGVKANIVPYAIAKILNTIPKGYSVDWEKIWNNQDLSPAFKDELAITTKMANDFLSDSHGILISEFAKKKTTWEYFRDEKEFSLSQEFLDELITKQEEKEKEKTAKTEQKEINHLQIAMEIVTKGGDYWRSLLEKGKERKLFSLAEESAIKQAIKMSETGAIPSPNAKGVLPQKAIQEINAILEAEEKMEIEGLTKGNADNPDEPNKISITLTNYKLH